MNLSARPTAIVLLSVYNGEKFLPDLLNSILPQLGESGVILVRDDGSCDRSQYIVTQFSERNPGRILLISDDHVRLGPSLSFSKITLFGLDFCARSGINDPLFFFADQDDVWCKDKVEIFIQTYFKNRATNDDIPVLLFSDLVVVDSQLNVLSRSFWSYQGIVEKKDSLSDLLISNIVTGCACAFNRKAARIAIPVSPDAIMHDWWFALVCSRFGRIIPITIQTVLYRQHQHNTLGAIRKTKSSGFVQKVRNIMAVDESYFTSIGAQAESFGLQFSTRLTWLERHVIGLFAWVFITGGFKARLLFSLLFKLRSVR